ncbi:hypothetical protein M569_01578, partial [Genlisea aurea]
MNEEDVNACQIQEWYPKFKSVSIRTSIHELPESFIHYLLDDSGSLLLPLSIAERDAFPKRICKLEEEGDFVVQEGSGDESEKPPPPPSFPDLELATNSSIETLGGVVFPKLNWSSPKDAAWISSTGNLGCTSFSEIVLLLKSSDSVIHDLCYAYDSCKDRTSSRPSKFFLALRKWYPTLKPEMEFRCFVKDNHLVGVCQREVTNFYPALVELQHDLKTLILEFFMGKVEGKFGSKNYTFDVYVTKDKRVKVLDFNPWSGSTLPLLFSWEELESNARDDGEFRIIESRHGIRPGLKSSVPFDYLDTSLGSGWDQFLRKVDEESKRQTSAEGIGS